MLPVLTELVPCLKAEPTAWLTTNLFLIPTHYDHAAHFTYSHTLLPPGPLSSAILGMTSPWGTLWGHDIAWQRSWGPQDGSAGKLSATAGNGVPFDGRITPAAVTSWLRALAARIALPPARQCAAVLRCDSVFGLDFSSMHVFAMRHSLLWHACACVRVVAVQRP
jgi:hypothetical protein